MMSAAVAAQLSDHAGPMTRSRNSSAGEGPSAGNLLEHQPLADQ